METKRLLAWPKTKEEKKIKLFGSTIKGVKDISLNDEKKKLCAKLSKIIRASILPVKSSSQLWST